MSLLTVILKWFVDSDIASATIREGKLISEEDNRMPSRKGPQFSSGQKCRYMPGASLL